MWAEVLNHNVSIRLPTRLRSRKVDNGRETLARTHYYECMPANWWEYVQRTSRHVPQKDIAAVTGIEQSTISRWKVDQTRPKAEAVVAFARAYRRSPVEALIHAGYIEKTEVTGVIEIAASAQELSSDDLVAELRCRIPDNPKYWGERWRRPAQNPSVDRGEDRQESHQLRG